MHRYQRGREGSMNTNVTDSIIYVGANDHDIDLFEGHFDVPLGMAYNSYVICDEKTAVMDTIDQSKTEEWLQNIAGVLKDAAPDYLIVQHMEPDHSASIAAFAADLFVAGAPDGVQTDATFPAAASCATFRCRSSRARCSAKNTALRTAARSALLLRRDSAAARSAPFRDSRRRFASLALTVLIALDTSIPAVSATAMTSVLLTPASLAIS